MSKYLKLFNNHAEYTAFLNSEDFIKPNVSHCIAENDVHYNPIETRLVVKYTVADATQPTKLYYYEDYDGLRGIDIFDSVEIDGQEVSVADLDTANGGYQMSAGEHTVKYTLKNTTSISRRIFMECEDITDVDIPNTVISIGNYAFGYCTGLTSFDIPDSVRLIDGLAFSHCTGITSIVVPDSVNGIGREAFSGCSSLSQVTLGSGITTIQGGAFDGCSLKDVSLDCPNVGSWFQGLQIENVTLGENVQTIEDGAFCGCEHINAQDKASIENINPNTFCETYCIISTFPQDVEYAIFGRYRDLGYEFAEGDEIPDNEIITKDFSMG